MNLHPILAGLLAVIIGAAIVFLVGVYLHHRAPAKRAANRRITREFEQSAAARERARRGATL